MNKKFYLAGMAIILTVSLFVVGCPADTDIEYVDKPFYVPANPGEGGEGTDVLPDGVFRDEYPVSDEEGLTAALKDASVKVVGIRSADGGSVTLSAAAPDITKPLVLHTPVVFSSKAVIESPVYVISHGVLNVRADGAAIKEGGSITVYLGGGLVVSNIVNVNDGDPKITTEVWGKKVEIFGNLTIDATTPTEISTALGYIEDVAELEFNAGNTKPSAALTMIPDSLTTNQSVADVSGLGLSKSISGGTSGVYTNNKVTAVANGKETEPKLEIRKNVALRTSDELLSVDSLDVSGGLQAPKASGNPAGLTIVVNANSGVEFGTESDKPIAEIKTGSSVASGGTLTVGKVTTITAINVQGGSTFDAGDVEHIASLTLAPDATLGLGAVKTGGFTAPEGSTVNGVPTKAGAGDYTDPASIPAKPTENANAEALSKALGDDAAVSGTTVRLNASTTLSKDVTVEEEITLLISKDVTLTIPTNKTLNAVGSLTGVEGSSVVLVGTGTVTGATFYKADGTSQTLFVAGVYEWNADADGKGKAGWKQTVLDVIATYTLVEDKEDTTANDPAKSGISIASALQDTATDVVTIKLAGTFKGEYVAVVDAEHSGTFGANWFKDMWGPADASNWANASQEPGVYGTVAITGLFPKALTTHAVEIKPYPALGYYIGVQETKTVLTSPAGPNEDRHYIPTDLTARQKWTYSTSKVKDEILDVILYNGGTTAAEKSVTVDIVNYTYDAEAADGAKYVRGAGILKVTIDYSDVAFPKVAVPADPQ